MEVYRPKSEEEWHALRAGVVTASLTACLVGANRYQSMQSSWDKRGDFQGNCFTKIGQLLEPVVVELTNMMLNESFELFEQEKDEKVFYIDPVYKIGATPDAHNGSELLECKTTKPFNYVKYGNNPPEYYIIQLMTQLHVTEMNSGYLSIMSTDLSQESPDDCNWPISIFKVEKDQKIIDHICNESLRFFDCQEKGKKFRVDGKVKSEVRLRIRTAYEKIL